MASTNSPEYYPGRCFDDKCSLARDCQNYEVREREPVKGYIKVGPRDETCVMATALDVLTMAAFHRHLRLKYFYFFFEDGDVYERISRAASQALRSFWTSGRMAIGDDVCFAKFEVVASNGFAHRFYHIKRPETPSGAALNACYEAMQAVKAEESSDQVMIIRTAIGVLVTLFKVTHRS